MSGLDRHEQERLAALTAFHNLDRHAEFYQPSLQQGQRD
jgi:hypothetical protein